MKTHNYGLYAVAIAIMAAGALWAGLPGGSLVLLGFLVVCPLMMFFMMRGAGGMHGGGMGDGGAEKQSDAADRPVTHDHGTMR